MWSIWNGCSLSNWFSEGICISQKQSMDCEAKGFYLPVQCCGLIFNWLNLFVWIWSWLLHFCVLGLQKAFWDEHGWQVLLGFTLWFDGISIPFHALFSIHYFHYCLILDRNWCISGHSWFWSFGFKTSRDDRF